MFKPELSIVVPTYNEAKNLEVLCIRIFDSLKQKNIKGEVIVVDDQSPDGTAQIAKDLGIEYPVRVYIRGRREGPGPAILDGIRLANAPIICVMDADLSHPPEAIPEMYQLIKQGKARLVIGSRHVQGGGTSKWIWYRKFFSWGARLMGKLLTPVNDLTSGFFMFDCEVYAKANINPVGCKVGLELMVKGSHQGKVMEYPIVFLERASGESKMGWRETKQYIQHLFKLGLYKIAQRP